MTVEFVDRVPIRNHRENHWDEVANELKTRPGEWAIVARGVKGASGLERLKRRGCEAVSRGRAGALDLYARWPKPGD